MPKVVVVTTTTTTTTRNGLDGNSLDNNSNINADKTNSDSNRNISEGIETQFTRSKDAEPLDEEWPLHPRNIKSVKTLSSKF